MPYILTFYTRYPFGGIMQTVKTQFIDRDQHSLVTEISIENVVKMKTSKSDR